MAKDLLDKTGLTYLATKFQEWCEGLFVKKDTEYKNVSATNKGVKVSLGGTIATPTISVETTVGDVSENNSGIVGGDKVKAYVDANKGVNTVFAAQTSTSVAKNGLVPAPSSTNSQKYLRGDGTWQTPVSVIDNLTSTSATEALSAAQGKILNEKFGAGVYDLGAFYNYPDGCLIELGELAAATMVTIHITGYAYYAAQPYDSQFVFYDWVNNSKEREIIYCGGLNLGYPLGSMKVYHYNNKIYVWIKQTGNNQTLSFRVHSNRTNLTPTVTNSSIHTTGVTLLTEIEPKNPLSVATSTSNGLMSSEMAALIHPNLWSGAKAFGDNKHENLIYVYGKGSTCYFISDQKDSAGNNITYTMINDGNIGRYEVGSASVAKKLGTDVVGSTKKPIYLNNGTATPIDYIIEKSVPSDAVFTDTTYGVATTGQDGLMSKSWVSKMDRITVTPDGHTSIGEYGTPTKRVYVYGTGFYYTPDNNKVHTVLHTGNIDTKYTAKNIVSNSASATENVAASNGDVHINLVENNTCRSGINITGSGATLVTSDAYGNITITSDDTTYVAMKGATASSAGTMGLVPRPVAGQESSYLRGDGTWDYKINEFGYTGAINIGTSFSHATGWFRIAKSKYGRSLPSVFRVILMRNYSYSVPEAYVFDICTSYHSYDPISITQVAGQASTVEGNKLIDKIRVTRDTSSTDSLLYFDFHVNLSKTGNQFFWYVIGNASSYTESEVVHNPTITSTTETHEFETVNGFKTNGDIYEGGSTLSEKYTTKSDITSGNITAAKATTADSANAIGGKSVDDLVQGGGMIKYIKVVTALPANPSNDTLYLIKQ